MKIYQKAYLKLIATLLFFIICTISLILFSGKHQFKQEHKITITPKPKSIKINLDEKLFQNIIEHPETRKVKLTLFNLIPKEHRINQSTETGEVMIITLSGRGEIKIISRNDENKLLNISTEHVAYIPTNTKFNISNTGTENLKYLYIVIG